MESLRLNETDLDTKRMFDLMAVSNEDQMPLYLHVVKRILREMRIEDQKLGDLAGGFDYAEFKRKIEEEGFTGFQSGPLNQRLETLESFMNCRVERKGKNLKIEVSEGTDWEPEVCMRLPLPSYLPSIILVLRKALTLSCYTCRRVS